MSVNDQILSGIHEDWRSGAVGLVTERSVKL